jgi:nitrite reductase (NADH) large subunit
VQGSDSAPSSSYIARKRVYLDRTCHYVARVGLDHVKAAVVSDPLKRKALYERLLFALKDYADPWREAVEKPAVRREYQVIEIKEVAEVSA